MLDSIARQLRVQYLSNISTSGEYDNYDDDQMYELIDAEMTKWDSSTVDQKINLLISCGYTFDSTDAIYYRSQL